MVSQKVPGIPSRTENERKGRANIVVLWGSEYLFAGGAGLKRFRIAVALMFRLS
jgi:hypothetical protein